MGAIHDRASRWLLAAACIVQVALAGREAWAPPPDFNDDVLHAALARSVAEAFRAGEDPTDPWVAPIAMGFPVAHHYQHLVHVVAGGASVLTGASVESCLRWLVVLALTLLPLSVAMALRLVGAAPLAAGIAGALVPLVATNSLYGIDLTSYLWGGFGLSTQAVAVTLLPLAWALVVRALQGTSSALAAGLLVSLLVLTHTVFGWIAVMSAILAAALLRGDDLRRRLLRLVRIGLAAACGCAYFVVPFVLDAAAMNRSVWEPAHKYDSHGIAWVLGKLGSGLLLDDRAFAVRPPLVTLLAALGLGVSLRAFLREPLARGLVILFGCSLALFAGRPTWGGAIDWLPLGERLHFHRLIVPVQLAALALAGIGGAAFFGWARAQRRRALAALLAGVVLLGATLRERVEMSDLRQSWQAEARRALDADAGALASLLALVAADGSGRAYAGRSRNWGKSYAFGALPVYALLADADVDSLGSLFHGLSHVADVQGYFDERRASHYELFNVRWLLAPLARDLPQPVTRRAAVGAHQLGVAVSASGYFGVIDAFGRYGGDRRTHFEATRAWLAGPGPDRRLHPVMELPGEIAPGVLPYDSVELPGASAARGRIVEQRARPGFGSAEVEAERAAHVVFRVSYHPGFHARVDGHAVPVLRVAPGFMAVAVAPGRHTIEFRWESPAHRAWLRWAGWLSLLAAAGWRWRMRLRPGSARRLAPR